MAIVIIAIDRVIGNDREKDVVPGEVSYCGQAWFPGLYRDHSYEGHFKKLRDVVGLLEYRIDEKKVEEGAREVHHSRVPDASVASLPAGTKTRTQEAMSHWWTGKGWTARRELVKEAFATLEEEGHDVGFLRRRVQVPMLRIVR